MNLGQSEEDPKATKGAKDGRPAVDLAQKPLELAARLSDNRLRQPIIRGPSAVEVGS
jgi:hypothetical protein